MHIYVSALGCAVPCFSFDDFVSRYMKHAFVTWFLFVIVMISFFAWIDAVAAKLVFCFCYCLGCAVACLLWSIGLLLCRACIMITGYD